MTNLRGSNLGRRGRNTVVTKSGKALKINRSLADRVKSNKLARQAEKAAYLSTLPKNRFKRILFRLHPKRVAAYWFSREGGIMALKIVGICIVASFFLTIGLFAYFRKDLPKIKDISGGNLGGSITYYDRTGKVVLWQDYDAVKRVPVQSNQISPYMKDATVAIEDKGFYHEGAFDVRGIMRAAVHDAAGGGGSLQGGSTITQQLVKLNENWTDNRTITRKVKELILSVELEREYSKDDILTGYLNIAPYGGVDYGVQSASEDYFHTSAADLTLPEAATLAAMPQAPSYYSPYGSTQYNAAAGNTFDQGALIGREQYILDQMAKQGYITQAQADAAKKVNVLALVQPLASKYQGIQAPYFVLAAKNQLEQKYGATIVERGGWKVITTIDMNLQAKAEQAVAKNLPNVERYGGDEEATVLENVPTGQIEALVGGVNFNQPDYGQINYADQVLIPPGSSFKPYDYSTLINTPSLNAGAGSVLYDTQGPIIDPATGAGYPCTDKNNPKNDNNANCLWDYDFRYPGPLTLRYAIGGSRNVPAVKAMIEAGVTKTISTASAMMDNPYLQSQHQNTYNCYAPGTDLSDATPQDESPCYPSAAIGDGAFLHLDDHVNGLATLGRMGSAIPRTFILQIYDASGNTIYKWTQPKGTQVINQDTAYIMDNMLSDPRASYLPGSCTATTCTSLAQGGYKFQHDNGWDFAVKTGTTNDNFDGLMTSWSTQWADVSWVGYHTRNKAMTAGEMEYMTEPLTRGMMEAATAGEKPVNWVQPSDIKVEPAYVIRNHVGIGSEEPSPSTDIFPSWYQPKGGSNIAQTIDKVSGLLATSCTPADAKEVEGNSNLNSFSIDEFVNGTIGKSTAAVTSNDNVHNCNDSPPTVTLTLPPTCDASDNGGSGCTITATVTQGTHPLGDPNYPQFPGTVTFTLNGQTINTQHVTDSPSTVSFDYEPTSSGSGTVSVTVTDSVLYQGTDSGTLNYTAGSPLTIQSPNSGPENGSPVTVSWSGGSGTFTVAVDGTPSSFCQNVSTNNCNVPVPIGSHTIGLTDSVGDSTSVSITRVH
jgi:penicillin-binding protein 1A